MRKTHTLLGLLLLATVIFFVSCASTPQAAPTNYTVTVSKADGFEVAVEPQIARRGFDSFLVTLNNTSDKSVQILWSKSTVQAGDKDAQLVFIEGQDVSTANYGAPASSIAAQKKATTKIYSVEQVSVLTDYNSSEVADNGDTETVFIEPLRANAVTISLVIANAEKEQTVTATIAPESAATAPAAPPAQQAEAAPEAQESAPAVQAAEQTAAPEETEIASQTE